jgi:peptidoglycan hydrolase-like protein with peptidoglycan-binding domain
MPWDYESWGCGKGSKGSCNNGWMQFEICEDNLNDKTYFEAIYKEACELTAYYCKLYNLDPHGTVKFNGIEVPVILCHQDSYKLKLGSNHSDIYPWFKKYGKTMDDVRDDVAALLAGAKEVSTSLRKGDKGEKVKKLQQNLVKLGYSLSVDGSFGGATEKTVKQFQKDNNLTQDGIVGAKTQSAIEYQLERLEEAKSYSQEQFIKDIQKAFGAKVDGKAGSETLSKTLTLSRTKNRKHPAVKYVQKRLYALGFTGVGEADGKFGPAMEKAVKAFQKTGRGSADGEITAKQTTWKRLLGMSK